MKLKTISLPELNNLDPTLESTFIKMGEEQGELAECIGKFRNLSGENNDLDEVDIIKKTAKELMDVAQACVTMMFKLEEQYGINLDEIRKEHIKKLEKRGYIKNMDK
ncbi:nucleotide pyrophosphohydrolase [Clostridioides difficile]|nr:nucleotide pyrophosphohydrolase [Clostridioides difficile]